MKHSAFKRSSEGTRLWGIWIGALGCFVLAAATGVLFRYGMLAGLPAGLSLGNLRHAHSHLMYFGWVTPALMAMIVLHLVRGRIPSSVVRIPWITLLLGLAAYVPFLLYGYQPVEWAGRRLPLATMAAGLNIFAWYAYGVVYFRWTRRFDHPARPWWDLAVSFLILSSLGAWGRAGLTIFRIEDPFWESATVHFFLYLFADGWLILALIGLAGVRDPEIFRALPRWSWWALALGTPWAFLSLMPPTEVPWALRLLAGVGGGAAALALGMMGLRFFRTAPLEWRVPLVFLGMCALAKLGFSVPPIASWALEVELRIPYLHLLLLGFVTLGLMAGARQVWGAHAAPWLSAMFPAVGLMMLSLVPLTGLWPSAWSGRWVLVAAMVGALFPFLIALGMFGRILWVEGFQRGLLLGSSNPGMEVRDGQGS
ncbi:MAG: hypothetical protein RMM10_01965 [Anaerolineae bacterium]|uniref:hypothetical protein n=1 Tax=Thermoflexus sp. TaxID=1969742 RepID=UPI0025D4458B|nr:hypothetical protein [Thermoflexus sp.]MCS7350267.1 hypothetical protein [Thermoflexus sp.]MDW8179718.1 hypothetical protein [Anaerolineae bacterium]